VKVRIGIGFGARSSLNDARFGPIVDLLEALGFDSLWVSERITSPTPDPLIAMAYAAGRTQRLKFGMSVMVLPGRNPVVLAKALASLSTLSGGRLLPAFGLGAVDPIEQQAFGVERAERAAWFDEALHVMRQCWTGELVVHDGARFHYDGVRVRPVPPPLDVWLGGIADSELRRVGRLGDGWLPSFVTPAEVETGRRRIEQVCADHDRSIEPDHFGVLIPYAPLGTGEETVAMLARRRPGVDPDSLVADSLDRLAAMIGEFVEAGASKFVVLPLVASETIEDWSHRLTELADGVLPLEAELSRPASPPR
jgi:probable F420-dependent oxidoreductase